LKHLATIAELRKTSSRTARQPPATIRPLMLQTTNQESNVETAVGARGKRLAGRRVAMVTFSPYPFDPRPRRAVDALVGEGAGIDLICLGSEDAPRREVLNGINVLRVPLKHDRRGKFQYAYRYSAFILVSSLIFALRSLARRYDLVYVHNMPDILVLSAMVPKALGAKVVLDLHDPMPELMMTIFRTPKNSSGVQLLRSLEKWSIARSDLAVTVNLACKRIFSTRSCRPEKVAVVMNAPDDRIFPLRAPEPSGFTNRSNNKPFVIMYHGSLVERNGLDLAIDALARVREIIPMAELRVFGGKTPFLERMMEMARERDVHEAVHYLGPRRLEDLVTEIGNCDLGIIPNHRNAFTEINTPTRIFEYLALGKPVIAPSTPGIQDYFSQDSLLFFPSGDAGGLAQQIQYAFFHPHEVLETVRRGQRIFLEHTWERERETLLNRVSAILETPQQAGLIGQ
jgi:glycosyltransferase involved in cell wall biosynthesis